MVDRLKRGKNLLGTSSVNIAMLSYPPRSAILRFFLKVADSSQAGKPPGIAADLHTPKSPKMVVAAVCSL